MKRLTNEERKKQIREIATMADEEVDFSDIPELTDGQLARAVRGRMYRPIKKPVTLRLDADVIQWLKRRGPGYQTRVNGLLRSEMLRGSRTPAKSSPSARAKHASKRRSG